MKCPNCNKDLNEVKKYAQISVTDTDIEAFFKMYQNIDYSSFSIDSIDNSEGEPVTTVIMSFKHKDGSLSSSEVFIEFYESEIRIKEFL